MSADATVVRSAEDWVACFVALAKRMQMATGKLDPSRPAGVRARLGEENRQASKELGVMLVPIRSALSQAQVDALLNDEDRDVRLVAALVLGSKNEELRLSAIKASLIGVGTADILGKRARARSKPPAAQRPEAVAADELVARLIDACERKALADRYLDWGTNTADRKICDQRLIEIVELQECLKARGLADHVMPLMDADNSQARISAALVCLAVDEARALATLESVEKTGGFCERDAAHLLLVQLGKRPW